MNAGTQTMRKVRVIAGAKREKIERMKGGVRISVTEPAQDNRANARVRALLAADAGVPVANVRLVSGHHRPSKLFTIFK